MFSRRISRLSRGRVSLVAPVPSEPSARAGIAVTGLLSYLENGVGMAADGTQWTAASGTNAVSSGGNVPTYEATGFNGNPSYAFTKASSHFLSLDALATALSGTDQAFAIFAAIQWTAAPATGDVMFGVGNSGSTTQIAQFRNQTSAWNFIRRDNASSLVQASSSGAPDTNRHVLALLFSGTTITLRIDGVAVTGLNGAAMDVGAVTYDRFTIGAYRNSSGITVPSSIRLAEFAAYNVVPSGADITAIETDMARLV